MRLTNLTRGSLLGDGVRKADGAWSRMRGLLGRGSLDDGEGLALVPCSSVHMLFMRFAIDLIYVDRDDRVVKLVRNLRPFRFSACLRGARYVVELPVGAIDASGTSVGDQLELAPAKAAAELPQTA